MFVDVRKYECEQNLVSKINIRQIHVNFYVHVQCDKKNIESQQKKPLNVINVRKIEFRCMVVKYKLTKSRKHLKTFHVAKEFSACLAQSHFIC